MLNSLIIPYEYDAQLLCTIPYVDRNNAITVISEIDTDMTLFSNSKRLCCWQNLLPATMNLLVKRNLLR